MHAHGNAPVARVERRVRKQKFAVGAAFGDAPLATGLFFLRLSGTAAVAWVPVLLLTWLGLAQLVEKRKGRDKAQHR